MPTTITLEGEHQRLAAVRRYEIVDTPPDNTYERITALAARRFGVPIALISIVDENRVWFKSHHGLAVSEISRAPGLCSSAILSNEPYILTDASVDPRALVHVRAIRSGSQHRPGDRTAVRTPAFADLAG